MNSQWIRPDDVTKKEMEIHIKKLITKDCKLNTTRFFKSLECRTCEQCRRITENKREYVITCTNGYSHTCDIGQARPIDCLKYE